MEIIARDSPYIEIFVNKLKLTYYNLGMDTDPSVIKLLSVGSEEDSTSLSGTNGEGAKNPKLEQMRSRIKGILFRFFFGNKISDSLFKRKVTSKSEAVSLNYIEENSLSPIKQPGPFRRRGTASPNNPKLEKFRNLVKGSLWQYFLYLHNKGSLSFVNSIASGSENQFPMSPDVSELGLTPTSRSEIRV